MKNLVKLFVTICLVLVCVSLSKKVKLDDLMCHKKLENTQELMNGDVIFHTSTSSQSEMLQIATGSELTHVGVIFIKNNKPYVFEAVQPVKITPLNEFINRGVSGKYKVLRLKTPLSESQIKSGISYSKKQLGKSYDLKFQWGDKKMYCSELVWKIYNNMGIEICETKKFSDFNLTNESVKNAIQKRYGNNEFNMDESVVAPSDIYNSSLLYTVFNTY